MTIAVLRPIHAPVAKLTAPEFTRDTRSDRCTKFVEIERGILNTLAHIRRRASDPSVSDDVIANAYGEIAQLAAEGRADAEERS
jgi:hypothetical protein